MAVKRKRKKSRKLLPFLILIGIAAVIATVLVFRFAGPKITGEGYPIRVSGLSVQQMELLGSDLAVSEDAAFRLYDRSGNERYMVELDYSAPVFIPCKNRVLIYERGGTRMKICDRNGEVCSKEAQGAILTCGFGGGRAAVATLADNTTSRLTVYDSNFIQEIFVWQTSSYIARAAVSPNGRYLAVAVIDNEGGDIYTELSVFDTKSADTLFSNRYSGEVILDLSFTGNSDILVLTDRSLSGVTGLDRMDFQVSFDYGTLKASSCSEDGRTALIHTKISDGKDYLYVYDKNGEVLVERQIDTGARSLSFSRSVVSVLYEDQVLQYSSSDAEAEPARTGIQSDSLKIVSSGSTCYLLTSEEIQKF